MLLGGVRRRLLVLAGHSAGEALDIQDGEGEAPQAHAVQDTEHMLWEAD